MKKILLINLFFWVIAGIYCKTPSATKDGNSSRKNITEKYWKLTELNGRPIVMDSGLRREPHIIFKEKDFKIIGNGGCNNITGTYHLQGQNGINIKQLAATKMACLHLELEAEFLKTLESADSYTIEGDMLILIKAQTAALTRFKAVYMD